jgi:hypothetical protein
LELSQITLAEQSHIPWIAIITLLELKMQMVTR